MKTKEHILFGKTLEACARSTYKKPWVLLESGVAKEDARSFLFCDPQAVLVFNGTTPLDRFFSTIEHYRKRNFWLAGYFSYEFGYFLEEKLRALAPAAPKMPFAWLGVFKKPLILHNAQRIHIPCAEECTGSLRGIQPAISEAAYRKALQKIKYYLEEGDTYQVNYTFHLQFDWDKRPFALYAYLRTHQPTLYMAYLDTGNDSILSFSPELFFRRDKDYIVTRPMKGTLGRGKYLDEDYAQRLWLAQSRKNRAENVMIVDLLRNDLGKIAEKGTVSARDLFCVESYPTVLQMTSTIEARLRAHTGYAALFKALFPCGSVTGAPKMRTMQIIHELEYAPRGVYTGSIGYIAPYDEACFNVAIRTIHINAGKKATMGIGGGIVYDSSYKKEYSEALLKSQFLIRKTPDFSLIETLRLEKRGYYLIDLHLERLKRSCLYFDIPYEEKKIKTVLNALAKKARAHPASAVRLLVDRDARIHTEIKTLGAIPSPVRLCVSTIPIDKQEIFYYHKTTHRDLYESESAKAKQMGYAETLFTNREGHVTEGTFTNVFLLKKGVLYTPALSCGLLPGVLRAQLIGKGVAKEALLTMHDVAACEKIFIGNSVRGLMPAVLEVPVKKTPSQETTAIFIAQNSFSGKIK